MALLLVVQELLDIAVRFEVAQFTFNTMNAFFLMHYGVQNEVIIEATVRRAGFPTDLVPMFFHTFEIVLIKDKVAVVCETGDAEVSDVGVAFAVPMCGPALGWRLRRHLEFRLSEKLKLT